MENFCSSIARLTDWLNLVAEPPVVFAEPGFRQDLLTAPQPFIELYLATEGLLRISVVKESHVLQPGDVALANAHFGNVGREVEGPFRYGCISFEMPAEAPFRDWASQPLLLSRRAPDLARVQGLYREVARLYHGPKHPYRHVLLKAALLQLLACVGEAGTGPGESLGTQNPHVRRAIELMTERRADVLLALPQIAKRVGVSPSHLVRIFQANLGTSPMRYLTQLRVRQATGLLARSQLTIKEVAFMVGFRDQLYFSRVFRQETGQSPREFRRQAAGAAPV